MKLFIVHVRDAEGRPHPLVSPKIFMNKDLALDLERRKALGSGDNPFVFSGVLSMYLKEACSDLSFG